MSVCLSVIVLSCAYFITRWPFLILCGVFSIGKAKEWTDQGSSRSKEKGRWEEKEGNGRTEANWAEEKTWCWNGCQESCCKSSELQWICDMLLQKISLSPWCFCFEPLPPPPAYPPLLSWPSGNLSSVSYIPLEILDFEIPVPSQLSEMPYWGSGYGYFLDLHKWTERSIIEGVFSKVISV